MKWFPKYLAGKGFKSHRKSYEPWYDDDADYNTNAKSYYDYLARKNRFLSIIEDFINRLLNRDVQVSDTNSIDLTKTGNWIGDKNGENYDDVITLKADVKLSTQTEQKTLTHAPTKTFTVANATKIKADGVYTADLENLIKSLDSGLGTIISQINSINQRLVTIENDITEMKGDISNLQQTVTNLRTDLNALTSRVSNVESGLQKIVTNLFNSGAITSNDRNTFNFNTGRNIATGNINFFGGVSDGQSFIRTNASKTENDVTAGY